MKPEHRRRALLQIAMNEPDNFVAVIVYRSEGRTTERTISPIAWDGTGKLKATCLCREAMRTFYLGRIYRVRLQPANEVTPPVPIRSAKETRR